jgi:hypothetical protein
VSVADLSDKQLRRFGALHAKLHSLVEGERDKARREIDKFLKEQKLTTNDIPAIFARLAALNPSPPPPDPRDAGPAKPVSDKVTPADAIRELLRQYFPLNERQLVAATLYALFVFRFEDFSIAPHLHLESPDIECGKSTLIDALALLVPRPDKLENVSAAVLYAGLNVRPPPIYLLDECDNWDLDFMKAMRAVLNASYRRGGTISRFIGGHPKKYNVFGPIVTASIDPLYPAHMSRSIRIEMQRASEEEAVGLKNFITMSKQDEAVFTGVYQFATRFMQRVKLNSNPMMPKGVYGRHGDNWRPLVSVADAISPEWGRLAREAALAFMDRVENRRILLLRHTQVVFNAEAIEHIPTLTLINKLRAGDEFDGEWGQLTPKTLRAMLRPFGIKPKQIWPTGPRDPALRPSFRGYDRADFELTWARYLDKGEDPPSAKPTLRLV